MSAANKSTSPERIAAINAIRDRFKGDSARTQRERLLAVLQELGPTSTFELSRYADIYYPPARKLELVTEGHDILTLRRETLTEAGASHWVGVYSLKRGGAAVE